MVCGGARSPTRCRESLQRGAVSRARLSFLWTVTTLVVFRDPWSRRNRHDCRCSLARPPPWPERPLGGLWRRRAEDRRWPAPDRSSGLEGPVLGECSSMPVPAMVARRADRLVPAATQPRRRSGDPGRSRPHSTAFGIRIRASGRNARVPQQREVSSADGPKVAADLIGPSRRDARIVGAGSPHEVKSLAAKARVPRLASARINCSR